jgi:hypothetical protein
MNAKSIILFLPLLTAASAKPPAAGGPPPHRPPPPWMMLDTDKDGEISASEMEVATTTLKSLDHNGDGRLTHAELGPPHPPHPPHPPMDEEAGFMPPPGPPPCPPVIQVLDSDRDGSISSEEIEKAPQALAELDFNGDGTLTPRELHPHGPPDDEFFAPEEQEPSPQGNQD